MHVGLTHFLYRIGHNPPHCFVAQNSHKFGPCSHRLLPEWPLVPLYLCMIRKT